MIAIVIVGPSIEEARMQIKQATTHADLVELCLDRFNNRDPHLLRDLLAEFSIPMIFTLRSQTQGGSYKGNESSRLEEIKILATCRPAYLILEDVPQPFLDELQRDFPEIKLIISYHNFNKSPENIDQVMETMPKVPQAFYKIAVMAHSTMDALRLMIAAKKYEQSKNCIFISMGEQGEISRILARNFGSLFTYSCLEDHLTSAPGQIPAHLLINMYQYRSIHPNKKLFGLIGSPITGSISHLTHNACFQVFNLDAVYVKMKVEVQELGASLSLMRTFGFRGLSVTMPLKEAVLAHLDDIDPFAKAIGAVNTLLFEEGGIKGFNTDGYGALTCLDELGQVNNKKVIILGAGGAARSIAFEAVRRGAKVIILNRTEEKAKQMAEKFGCEAGRLELLPLHFKNEEDILINCLPYYLPDFPINSIQFIKNAIVMDITTKPMNTLFLKAAQSAGCRLVYGYQMFVRQALKQFEIWFPGKIDPHSVLTFLSREALLYNS